MVGESNQNVFLIQMDALSSAEFEISEFEISSFDCTVQILFTFGMYLIQNYRDVLDSRALFSHAALAEFSVNCVTTCH